MWATISHLASNLKLLPRLSALTSESTPNAGEQPAPHTYTAVSLLTAHGAVLLNALFGTNVEFESDKAALCADISTRPWPDAPSIVLLATPRARTSVDKTSDLAPLPLSALAAADVWVAVVPANVDGEWLGPFLDALLGRIVRLAEAQHSCGGGAVEEPAFGGSSHRLLLLFSPDSGGGAPLGEQPDMASAEPQKISERLERLWEERRPSTLSTTALSVRVAVADVPPRAERTAFQAAGAELLARFLLPSHAGYLLDAASLLHAPPAPLSLLPLVLDELHLHLDRPVPATAATIASQTLLPRGVGRLPATPANWAQLLRYERARRLAMARASEDGERLRAEQEAAGLNPVHGFAARANALHDAALGTYAQHATATRADGKAGNDGLHAYAAKELQLRRDVAALLLRLTRSQLRALRAGAVALIPHPLLSIRSEPASPVCAPDALDAFQADLAIRMAEAKVYKKAAGRLCDRDAARFERAVHAALPQAVARGRVAAMPRRARSQLLQQARRPQPLGPRRTS
jgi:hypothetical protein